MGAPALYRLARSRAQCAAISIGAARDHEAVAALVRTRLATNAARCAISGAADDPSTLTGYPSAAQSNQFNKGGKTGFA